MKAGSSQWPLTTTIALGGAGSVPARPSRNRWVAFQVSAGPQVQSMKKQGPPPWGRKRAGWRDVFLGIREPPLILALTNGQTMVVTTTTYRMPAALPVIHAFNPYSTGGARKSA